MSVTINGQRYYRSAEVCRMVGISKSALFHWLKKGIFRWRERRDRRGWRLFTEDEIARLKQEVNKLDKTEEGRLP